MPSACIFPNGDCVGWCDDEDRKGCRAKCNAAGGSYYAGIPCEDLDPDSFEPCCIQGLCMMVWRGSCLSCDRPRNSMNCKPYKRCTWGLCESPIDGPPEYPCRNMGLCSMQTAEECYRLGGLPWPGLADCNEARDEPNFWKVRCCTRKTGLDFRCRDMPTRHECEDLLGQAGYVTAYATLTGNFQCGEICGGRRACCIWRGCVTDTVLGCMERGGLPSRCLECGSEWDCCVHRLPCCHDGTCTIQSEEECGMLSGVWSNEFLTCEEAAEHCKTLATVERCERGIWGPVDDERTGYMRLQSLHEVGVSEGRDCEICQHHYGDVDPQVGPWICGQSNANDSDTRRHYTCDVVINDDGTLDDFGVPRGYGAFSCSYEAACPESN